MKRCIMLLLMSSVVFVCLAEAHSFTSNHYYLPLRRTPAYSFVNPPQVVNHSSYDYFFGSYSGHPLRVIPPEAGGGYIFCYQSRPLGNNYRRVYKGRVSAEGVVHSNTIGGVVVNEGFPATVFDPETSTAFIAWHVDYDGDGHLETMLDYYTLAGGIPSPIWTPQIVFDAPTELATNQTLDNEFIWPELSVGPSPVPNKRRLYVMGRNYTTHTTSSCENILIAYADFDANDIAMGSMLDFEYTSIPLLDDWNTDPLNWRRVFFNLKTDANGRVIVAGMHRAYDSQSSLIDEEDIDYFVNDNYGEGTWQRISRYSHMPVWDPVIDGVPLFGGNSQFTITSNGSKTSTAIDNLGRIHVPGIWVLNSEMTPEMLFYPNMQYLKESIFDPVAGEIALNEVYPVSANPDAPFTPWDVFPPWNELDGYDQFGNPLIQTYWPFPHQDQSLHYNSMMFHYGYVRMTDANDMGMMASLWQSVDNPGSPDSFPNINIAVSIDNGDSWSLPITLNSDSTPELQGQTPMWVYPADQMRFTGFHNGKMRGRLGLLYFDDFTWGSSVLNPPAHPVMDGGRIMFTEIDISFNTGTDMVGGYQVQVSDTNNVPIPWARIQLGDQLYTCNIQGRLDIEELSVGTWDLIVSKFGYASFEDVIEIEEGRTLMQTVILAQLAPVTLSGHVCGSDLPGLGLAGVFITFVGSGEILAVTDENGYFAIENMQPGAVYNLQLIKENYQILYRTGIVPEIDTDLGVIIMNELIAPPFHVNAEIVSQSRVLIKWQNAPIEDKNQLSNSEMQRQSQFLRYVTGHLVFLLEEEHIYDEAAWLMIHDGIVQSDSIYFNDWHVMNPGTYYFAVKTIYNTGNSSVATISNALLKPLSTDDDLILVPELTGRCYPNPARGRVNIELNLKKSMNVSIEIYNLRGQQVRRMAFSPLQAGTQTLNWDGRDQAGRNVSPGLYYIKIESPSHRELLKLLLMK